MPKYENCGWYPGKIAKIRSVEVVVGDRFDYVECLVYIKYESISMEIDGKSGVGRGAGEWKALKGEGMKVCY